MIENPQGVGSLLVFSSLYIGSFVLTGPDESINNAIHGAGLLGGSFCIYRSAITEVMNQFFCRKPPLTITRAEWGEEMPRHEKVSETSVALPLL